MAQMVLLLLKLGRGPERTRRVVLLSVLSHLARHAHVEDLGNLSKWKVAETKGDYVSPVFYIYINNLQ